MRILLITVSARGHAIADALNRSVSKPEIISICPVANPGLKRIASKMFVQPLTDLQAIVDVAKKVKPDFAVIGPEDPLADGIVDLLAEHKIGSVGPNEELARIESSKGFTRDLLTRYGIEVNPKYRIFTAVSDQGSAIRKYIEEELRGEYVVKFDALAGGKGVKVSGEHLDSIEDGVKYAEECIAKAGQVVVEEKLVGPELSLMSFVSGRKVISMPAVQDHKRAYEGNTGPNTGGMGSYSDANHLLPFLTEEDIEQAHAFNVQTAEALLEECKEPYRGILYGGFMKAKNGIRLIEYNCRFGDPEALNVLPILETDFVDICRGIISGELTESMVRFAHKATVCKYIVPKSYPVSKDERGQVVKFPAFPTLFERPKRSEGRREASPESGRDASPLAPVGLGRGESRAEAKLYFGDLSEDFDGTLRLGGSRTAGVVGIADTIEAAERIAQGYCERVEGPVRFRSDIGGSVLMEKSRKGNM